MMRSWISSVIVDIIAAPALVLEDLGLDPRAQLGQRPPDHRRRSRTTTIDVDLLADLRFGEDRRGGVAVVVRGEHDALHPPSAGPDRERDRGDQRTTCPRDCAPSGGESGRPVRGYPASVSTWVSGSQGCEQAVRNPPPPLPIENFPSRPVLLLRGVTRRCPWCGDRRAYFHGWFSRQEHCRTCGHGFRRGDHAFELGATTANFMLTLAGRADHHARRRARQLPGVKWCGWSAPPPRSRCSGRSCSSRSRSRSGRPSISGCAAPRPPSWRARAKRRCSREPAIPVVLSRHRTSNARSPRCLPNGCSVTTLLSLPGRLSHPLSTVVNRSHGGRSGSGPNPITRSRTGRTERHEQ